MTHILGSFGSRSSMGFLFVLAVGLCTSLLALAWVPVAAARPPLSQKLRSMLNNRPVIGVLTQPTVPGSPASRYGTSILNSDYVKWIEGSGARAAPVHYDAPKEQLVEIFGKINGLIFPGGPDIINHTAYYDTAEFLFNLALDANRQGDYFFVHGTCLGFELLNMLAAGGDIGILSPVDAQNISLPLIWQDQQHGSTSRIYSLLSDEDRDNLAKLPLTENYHHWGLLESTFRQNKLLTQFFKLVSTSNDRNGLSFVSSVESPTYPIYAVQWHPERSLFEWNPYEDIDHSPTAVRIMQAISRFLVQEAMKSKHRFDTLDDAIDALIYNYSPLYTAKLFGDGEQMYFFNYTKA